MGERGGLLYKDRLSRYYKCRPYMNLLKKKSAVELTIKMKCLKRIKTYVGKSLHGRRGVHTVQMQKGEKSRNGREWRQ